MTESGNAYYHLYNHGTHRHTYSCLRPTYKQRNGTRFLAQVYWHKLLVPETCHSEFFRLWPKRPALGHNVQEPKRHIRGPKCPYINFGKLVCPQVGVLASWLSASWTVGELDCRQVGYRQVGLSASCPVTNIRYHWEGKGKCDISVCELTFVIPLMSSFNNQNKNPLCSVLTTTVASCVEHRTTQPNHYYITGKVCRWSDVFCDAKHNGSGQFLQFFCICCSCSWQHFVMSMMVTTLLTCSFMPSC